MTRRNRLVLTAALLLPGTLAAQPNLEQARAAVQRDAERYSGCWMRRDMRCMSELINREMYPPVGAIIDGLLTLELSPGLPSGWANSMNLFSMELAESWPPFVVGDLLYAYVPFFAESWESKSGARTDRMGYLVGASRDDGVSWRFVAVTSAMSADQVNTLVPDNGVAPRPVSRDVTLNESPFERTRWLETVERRFAPAEGGYVYVLRLVVRRIVEAPIEVAVRYDDPADREQPAESQVSLTPAGGSKPAAQISRFPAAGAARARMAIARADGVRTG